MGSRKSSFEKKFYMAKLRSNSPVPAWVMLRTNREVRFNYKRRDWRHRKLR
ncbi:MAG: 50S ribosomal protein L39e [Nitrososphaeria archaeon]|jgi:large subunit ribosomal protein L39e|nr:50S ribosomal protein L39e [uncultured archaeon]